MIWSFDHEKLADEMMAAGYDILKPASPETGRTLHLNQVKSGLTVLLVPELLEMCELLGTEIERYIVMDGDPDTNMVFDGGE